MIVGRNIMVNNMGMYSFFETEDIKIKDGMENELTTYLKNAEYIRDDELTTYLKNAEYIRDEIAEEKLADKLIKEIETTGKISFEFMNDWKIISYWYENYVKFLRELNNYVEGYVVLSFETGEERAEINFGNQLEIKIGRMEWINHHTDENGNIIPIVESD